MPRREDYEGMSLAEALRCFAERHHDHATRHISADEYHLLLRAATVLEHDHSGLLAFT